jgi:hypothetical protein
MDEITTTSRRRRFRTVALATVALLGLAVAAPIGADASPGQPPPYHGCFPVSFENDDGPVTDLVHHNLEPLGDQLIPGSGVQIHNLNCSLWNQERAILQLLGLGG